MANQFFSYNNPNSTTTPTYTTGPPPPPLPAVTYTTTRATLADSYLPSDPSIYAGRYHVPSSKLTAHSSFPFADSYLPSDPSVHAAAARYLAQSSKLTAHSSFPGVASSSMPNHQATDIGYDGPYSADAFSRIGHMAGRDLWSGVDAVSYQPLALKRSSEALYHHNNMGAHNIIGQNDWLSMSYLTKRPRIEESSILPTYPQRPGEKVCTHYMLTRTCKFGETCKFDHPIWVPEGGNPERKEVPPVANGGLPERPGEPDCPYYLKTQKCKFGLNCKFNHPKEKEVDLGVAVDLAALPERPSEPPCAFYLKTGSCKFGASCKFHHPKNIQAPVVEKVEGTAERNSSAMIEGASGDVKFTVLPAPAVETNSKGLPIRPGELDCPFYLKTSSCKYGTTCRFNHPDQIGQTLSTSPAVDFTIGVGNPAFSSLHYFDQVGSATVVYPQRPGEIECDHFMKTGVCKFGERCRFHHPVDIAAPSAKVQKVTLAGYPRREGAVSCPYYMKTSTCKYGSTCKFDHPPPAEVLAMAAAAQANFGANETEEKEEDPNCQSKAEPASV